LNSDAASSIFFYKVLSKFNLVDIGT
jgi:hypothetical protein